MDAQIDIHSYYSTDGNNKVRPSSVSFFLFHTPPLQLQALGLYCTLLLHTADYLIRSNEALLSAPASNDLLLAQAVPGSSQSWAFELLCHPTLYFYYPPGLGSLCASSSPRYFP